MTEEEKRKERSARSVAQARSKGWKDQIKWGKEHIYHAGFSLNRDTDGDIIEFLKSFPKGTKADWFKSVCRQAMKEQR